jgi:hypothetical protein
LTVAVQVQDIFEGEDGELSLDDPSSLFQGFRVMSPTDAEVRASRLSCFRAGF